MFKRTIEQSKETERQIKRAMLHTEDFGDFMELEVLRMKTEHRRFLLELLPTAILIAVLLFALYTYHQFEPLIFKLLTE